MNSSGCTEMTGHIIIEGNVHICVVEQNSYGILTVTFVNTFKSFSLLILI